MLLNLLNLYSLIFALFSKIEGMSDELSALKPSLNMSVTITPNNTLNISETLAMNLPISCFEERVSCEPCNILPTMATIPVNLAPVQHINNKNISYVVNKTAKLRNQINNNQSKIVPKLIKKPLLENLVENETKKNELLNTKEGETPYLNSDEIDTISESHTSISEIETSTGNSYEKESIDSFSNEYKDNHIYTNTSDNSDIEITTSDSRELQTTTSSSNEIETTTIDSVSLALKELERLRYIDKLSGGSSGGENETISEVYDDGEYNLYDYENETEVRKSRSTTPDAYSYMDSYTTDLIGQNENSTEKIITDSHFTLIETESTTDSYILTETADNGRITEIESTLSTIDSTDNKATQSMATNTNLETDSTYLDLSSTIINTGSYVNLYYSSTPSDYIETSTSDSYPDSTYFPTDETLITNEISTISSITPGVKCPNFFNCTANCGGLNTTQVYFISNCQIVEKRCYVTKCDTKTDKINVTAIDIVYIDNHDRKMYNLTTKTKKKLLKLCWETMFGQELVKLTMMDLVSIHSVEY